MPGGSENDLDGVIGLGEQLLLFGLHKRCSKLQRLADCLHIVFRGIAGKRIEIGFYLLFLIELQNQLVRS